MGGAASTPTRKITIPNEETNVIRLSESVVDRLKKCTEKTQEEFIKQHQDPKECPPTEVQKNVGNKENMGQYPGDPLMNFYYGPSVTSLRVLQEKEKELKATEEYWTKRIQNMEETHAALSHKLNNEYNKAVEEITNQYPRPPSNTPFPCCDEKNKLLECYRKNPNEILLCAGEVTQFSDCVHSKRLKKKEESTTN